MCVYTYCIYTEAIYVHLINHADELLQICVDYYEIFRNKSKLRMGITCVGLLQGNMKLSYWCRLSSNDTDNFPIQITFRYFRFIHCLD